MTGYSSPNNTQSQADESAEKVGNHVASFPFLTFLKRLSAEPALQAAYQADPDAVASAHNVSAAGLQALKSGDTGEIEGQLDHEQANGGFPQPPYIRGGSLAALMANVAPK